MVDDVNLLGGNVSTKKSQGDPLHSSKVSLEVNTVERKRCLYHITTVQMSAFHNGSIQQLL